MGRRIGSFLSKFLVCCHRPKVSQSPPTRPDLKNPTTDLFKPHLIVSDAVPDHDADLNYFDALQDDEPTISFESPTDYGTAELANHALRDGCEDNSDEAEEDKGLLCVKDEEDVTDGEHVQNQLATNVALEEMLEEGNHEGSILDLIQEIGYKIIQFGEHAPKPRDGGSTESEEEQVLEDGSEEGDEAAGVCELFQARGQEEGCCVGRDAKAGEKEGVVEDVSAEGDEAAGVCELFQVRGQEEGFSVGRDAKAEEKEGMVEAVSQKVQEDVKNGELIKVNGQEDPLVSGDNLEDEEVKDMSEEGEVGVKGGGSVEDCLFGGFDSKDEVISLAEWGNFEEEENRLADSGYSEDKEYSLVEWGDFEQEGDAIEEWPEISKDAESVDLCNGDDGVAADRVDAIDACGGGYEEEEVKEEAIDAGGGGYEEEGAKEEAHHKLVEDIPKLKEREVFVGGLSCDSGEADIVKVLNVKMLDQTVFFMDPVTKNNKGFAFLQTEADLAKVLNETIFFVEPNSTKNSNGSVFLQSLNDDQANIGLSKLKDPLVNGMPYGVVPSQDCQHREAIMDAKTEGSVGCILAPGWETSALQSGSFYSLPQDQRLNVASTECYYPTQTVAGGNIHGFYTMQGGNEMTNLFQGQPFMGSAPTLADHGAITGSYRDAGGEVCWSSQAVSGAAGLCAQPQYSGVYVTSYWPNSEFLSCSANQEGYCCPVGTLGGYCGYVGSQEGCWGLKGGSDIAVCAC